MELRVIEVVSGDMWSCKTCKAPIVTFNQWLKWFCEAGGGGLT